MSDKRQNFFTYSKWRKLTGFQKCCIRHDILEKYKVPKLQKIKSQKSRVAPKTHIPAVHKKKKRYVCMHCKDTFFKISELQVHMKNSHEKSYECSKCTNVFSRKIDLKRHVKYAHVEQKKVFENPPPIVQGMSKVLVLH